MQKPYIINISFMVEPTAHAQWYEFFTTKFIPEIKSQGFDDVIFTRVLTNDNNPHYTYSLQLPDSTIEDYQKFMSDVMGEYSETVRQWFGEKIMHYVSLLKKIEL